MYDHLNLYCPEQLNAKATDVFMCENFVSKAIMRSSGHASWCTALYGDGYLVLVWQPWKLSVLKKVCAKMPYVTQGESAPWFLQWILNIICILPKVSHVKTVYTQHLLQYCHTTAEDEDG